MPAPPPDTRQRALVRRAIPWTLVALAGACGVSGAIGLALAATGRGPAPLGLLLLPPALVLVAAPVLLLRALRRAG